MPTLRILVQCGEGEGDSLLFERRWTYSPVSAQPAPASAAVATTTELSKKEEPAIKATKRLTVTEIEAKLRSIMAAAKETGQEQLAEVGVPLPNTSELEEGAVTGEAGGHLPGCHFGKQEGMFVNRFRASSWTAEKLKEDMEREEAEAAKKSRKKKTKTQTANKSIKNIVTNPFVLSYLEDQRKALEEERSIVVVACNCPKVNFSKELAVETKAKGGESENEVDVGIKKEDEMDVMGGDSEKEHVVEITARGGNSENEVDVGIKKEDEMDVMGGESEKELAVETKAKGGNSENEVDVDMKGGDSEKELAEELTTKGGNSVDMEAKEEIETPPQMLVKELTNWKFPSVEDEVLLFDEDEVVA